MIFESEMELMRFTESIRGKTFGEIDKLKLLEDGSTGSGNLLRKVVETGFYGYKLNDETNLNSIGIELKVVPFIRNNDGKATSKERLLMSRINYFDIVNEEFESSQLLRENRKVLIIWYEYVSYKKRTDMEIQYCQLYDMLQDQQVIKNDFELIQRKVKNGEAHLLSEGDTIYLGACIRPIKGNGTINQPNSNISAKPRFFSLKRSYMTGLLMSINSETSFKETVSLNGEGGINDHNSETSFKETVSPNGEGGINDHVTARDLLGRSFLVKELGDFYIEYSEKNSSPFYFGIFARWGMGKSSVIQMLMEHINKQKSKKMCT
ncbi:MutH/Sau3AI family endonuclease [Peribacillus sp. TH14]|uniref:MutH/Sau3AI family endonuclease n=1 Tax=Peribacillus sp. TH14 TaxID=2798481 RepID=UPI0019127E24|nr:MutH/Sau3AI family endonuclease [Peribacillus sp. TH14]MBK5502234.1 hypothetical protein [Peribacillus sp. TH14]